MHISLASLPPGLGTRLIATPVSTQASVTYSTIAEFLPCLVSLVQARVLS